MFADVFFYFYIFFFFAGHLRGNASRGMVGFISRSVNLQLDLRSRIFLGISFNELFRLLHSVFMMLISWSNSEKQHNYINPSPSDLRQ